MKTQFKILFSAAAFLLMGLVAKAQSGTTEEVPGDNFSLEGALELFKKSASPQEFEQLLNSPDSKVNNLDLNGDGEIDYIRVVDKTQGNVHDFIIQDVISANESQDVAVIELEKRSDGSAVLQIVGDADIYGVETIIEPTSEVRVNAGYSTARTTVNVWAWPSVQYVYGPYYNPWISPWGWAYYPGWYRPWRPVVWATWYPYWAPYRPYYAMCYRHRIGYASVIYAPYRTTSMIVYNRNYNQIHNFRNTSRSYQYNRGGYAHGNRFDRSYNGNNDGYNGGRTRSDYSNHPSRSDYNRSSRSDYNRSSRSDYNRTNSDNRNTRGDNRNARSDYGRTTQQQSNQQFSRPTRNFNQRGNDNGSNNNNSMTVNRSRSFSGPSRPEFHRSQPGSGGFRSAPSPQFRSAPSHNGGGGSGGHGGGGGFHRGH